MILNYHRYDEEQRKNITWVEGLKAMKSRQEVVQTFNQQLQEKGISLPEYEHNRYKNMEKVFQENLLQILTQ
ncbi:MAG: hypothetical protein LBO09_05140 [Candidatus Peribacteria bacterium]|jgi:hypothetical protein|nr:hypothetical protein [Candidatus Peribacteria bacterium]